MDRIKTQYQEIFDKFENSSLSELVKRGFCFQYDKEIRNPDVLFVGINPSYTDDTIFHTFYTKEDVKEISYFKSFDNLAKATEKTNLSWTHLDLLVCRETKQANISDVLLKTNEGIDFIYQQLLVSKALLEQINPKIIVVSNTMARKFLGKEKTENANKWLDYSFEFDKTKGTDIITSGKLKDTPVFFSSMLSGQRALDNGSKERLAWQIGLTLDIINKKI